MERSGARRPRASPRLSLRLTGAVSVRREMPQFEDGPSRVQPPSSAAWLLHKRELRRGQATRSRTWQSDSRAERSRLRSARVSPARLPVCEPFGLPPYFSLSHHVSVSTAVMQPLSASCLDSSAAVLDTW